MLFVSAVCGSGGSKKMAASLVQLAKRALVSVLLVLAEQYGVCLQISRDSSDGRVESAFGL